MEARSITKRYGPMVALDQVDVTVDAGSVLCILGPSGSGKSTLVRQLHLLEAPDAGEILLGGVATLQKGRPWRAAVRRFALVQQRPGLLRAPAIDNAAFSLRARGVARPQARSIARQWLVRLGLGSRLEARPDQLSGGETQRVALARALATRPEFLFIDEATNQLDPHWVREVEAILAEEARRGCGVVLVTHNVPQALRLADAFLFLENGRRVDAGTRSHLEAPQTEALRFFLETGA